MDNINDYLISKANSDKKNHKVVSGTNWLMSENYTYSELDYEVEKRIKLIKETYSFDKVYCFQIVNNTIEDIITFLALRRMNLKPILVNEKKIFDLNIEYDKKQISTNNNLVIMPIEKPSRTLREFQNRTIIANKQWIKDEDIQHFNTQHMMVPKDKYNYAVNGYLKSNKKIHEILETEDYDFAIPTSGTTGENKIITIKEKDLIEKIKNSYDLTEDITYIGKTPISAISGITFSLYLPILGDNITVASENLTDMLDYSENIAVLAPGNYIDNKNYLSLLQPELLIYDKEKFNQKVKKIILLGDKTSSEVINGLPKQEEGNQINNKIWNYYGRTENLGVVSRINIKDMQPVYLYYKEIYNDKIIYSPNKKDVYEIIYENGIRKEIPNPIEYQEKDFYEVLPIALVNNKDEDIKIKDGIFNEIIAEGYETGDFGFELDGKIYYLCRENELLKKENKYFYVTGLEEKINEQMNERVLLSRQKSKIEQKCFCIINENKNLNIYIPCRINYYIPNNFSRNYEFYKDFKDLIPKEIKVDKIILIDRSDVPIGREIGKIKRQKFLTYQTEECNNLMKNTSFDFETLMKSKLDNYAVDYKNDSFVFSKKDITFADILDIASKYKIYDYREDKDNYYIVFDDSLLFATEPKEKEEKRKTIDKGFETLADRAYRKKTGDELDEYNMSQRFKLRKTILKMHGLIPETFLGSNNKVTITKTEDSISAILEEIYEIDQDDYYDRKIYTIDDPLYEEDKIIFEKVLERSQYYEALYGDENYEIEYKLDKDNNFYLNNKLFDISTYEYTILGEMYNILLKFKEQEKVEKKQSKIYKKTKNN